MGFLLAAISPLLSNWGETLISCGLKQRNFVKFSQSDRRGLDLNDIQQLLSSQPEKQRQVKSLKPLLRKVKPTFGI